jgi:hypothetical protein
MQKFVDKYSEILQESGTVSKHVCLMTELSHIIDKHSLLRVSEIEQSLACEDVADIAEKVIGLLKSPGIPFGNKLRLVMLYALRYEGQKNELPTFRAFLRESASSESEKRSIYVCFFGESF